MNIPRSGRFISRDTSMPEHTVEVVGSWRNKVIFSEDPESGWFESLHANEFREQYKRVPYRTNPKLEVVR